MPALHHWKTVTNRLETVSQDDDPCVQAFSTALLGAFLLDPVYEMLTFNKVGEGNIAIRASPFLLPDLAEKFHTQRTKAVRAGSQARSKIFSRYCKLLGDMEQFRYNRHNSNDVYRFRHRYFNSEPGKALVTARIRGDVEAFIYHHSQLRAYIGHDLEQYRKAILSEQTDVRGRSLYLDEYELRIERMLAKFASVQRMLGHLEALVPAADTDTSTLGHPLAERMVFELIQNKSWE